MTETPMEMLCSSHPARTADAPPHPAATHIRTGQAGEKLVADLLTRAGWQILARNWRPNPLQTTVRGEIDIVAQRDGVVTTFEVKTRSGTGFGHPAEAVTPEKLRRLHALSRAWARENGVQVLPTVDVVAVHLTARHAPRVEHVKSLGWH